MNECLSFEELFVSTKNSCLGLPVENVYLVDLEQYNKYSIEELFTKLGIEFDELLYWQFESDEALVKDYVCFNNIKGWASYYIQGGVYKSVIFVMDNPDYEIDGVIDVCDEDEEEIEFKFLLKYLALIHELGHIDDFNKGINFNLSERKINLIEAEAYADVFALKLLKDKKSLFLQYAKKIMSKGILDRSFKEGFYSEVHNHIKKEILESELREWSREWS